MRNCQNCGTPNPEQASVCEQCGATLAPVTKLTATDPVEAIQAHKCPIPRRQVKVLAIIALALSLFTPLVLIAYFIISRSNYFHIRLPDYLCIVFILLMLLTPLLSVILSIIARFMIGKTISQGREVSFANSIIFLSIVLPLLVCMLYPVFAKVREYPQPTCTSNQRQLAMAMLMYAEENDDLLPGKANITPRFTNTLKQQWRVTDIQGLSPRIYHCPQGSLSGDAGPATAEYAMNAGVMGVDIERIPLPYATLLTADTKGTDAIFSAGDIDRRHNGGFIASFGDGHVAFFPSTVSTADPQQTPLQTGSNTAFDYNAPGIPAVNPFIIQGAMNVIEVAESKSWNSQPCCTIHRGKKLTTYIGDKGYCGNYLTVYYSQMPSESQTPLNLPIGAFVNGTAEDYTAKKPAGIPPYGVQATKNLLTVPAAGGKYGVFTTFWLPPVIGSDKSGRHYSHYNISGGPAGTVSITPAY